MNRLTGVCRPLTNTIVIGEDTRGSVSNRGHRKANASTRCGSLRAVQNTSVISESFLQGCLKVVCWIAAIEKVPNEEIQPVGEEWYIGQPTRRQPTWLKSQFCKSFEGFGTLLNRPAIGTQSKTNYPT